MIITKQLNPSVQDDILWLFLSSWDKWLNKENKEYDVPYENYRTRGCIEYLKHRICEGDGYVAFDGKRIMGYIIYSKSWNNLHIDDLYVREEYRKQGVASRLIDEVWRDAITQRCEYIHTDCDVDNVEVNALNIKMGFELIGMLKNYWDKDCNFYKRRVYK